MIEIRVAEVESLEEAVMLCAAAGLPGPVLASVCPGDCGFAHVHFLDKNIDDEELQEQLEAARQCGFPVVDGAQTDNPDGARIVVNLEGVMERYEDV